MNELDIYKWIGAALAAVLSVSWRVFLSGDTLRTVNRKMETLVVETIEEKKWDEVGKFLPRNDNKSIMRLCILQMQLLVFSWWFSLLLTAGCILCIGYIVYEPTSIINSIKNHTPDSGVNLIVSLPILIFLFFIVVTMFVAGYRRRLLDLTEDMKKRHSEQLEKESGDDK